MDATKVDFEIQIRIHYAVKNTNDGYDGFNDAYLNVEPLN